MNLASVVIMTDYLVKFGVRVSAKSKKDLYRKAERIGNSMTMCVGKKVYPISYGEIVQKETIKDGANDTLQDKE